MKYLALEVFGFFVGVGGDGQGPVVMWKHE